MATSIDFSSITIPPECRAGMYPTQEKLEEIANEIYEAKERKEPSAPVPLPEVKVVLEEERESLVSGQETNLKQTSAPTSPPRPPATVRTPTWANAKRKPQRPVKPATKSWFRLPSKRTVCEVALFIVAIAELIIILKDTKAHLQAALAPEETGTKASGKKAAGKGAVQAAPKQPIGSRKRTCPNDMYVYNTNLNSCYRFCHSPVGDQAYSWEKAREYCKGQTGDLVNVGTKAEHEWLVRMINGMFKGDKFWIGLRDGDKKDGVWKWIDTLKSLVGGFRSWSASMENRTIHDTNGIPECAMMANGVWQPWNCGHRLPFICEARP